MAKSKINYTEIFQPFINLFTQSQINTVLLAWLPTKLEPYMTGIIAVDMFITSAIACGVSTLFPALYQFLGSGRLPWGNKKCITVQIEYYTEGKYGYSYASVFYEALSWLISQQTKKLNEGSFIIKTVNSVYGDDDDDDCAPPKFNILPENDQKITFEYKGKKFYVTFQMPEQDDDNNNNNISYYRSSRKSKPSIYLTTDEDTNSANVDTTTEFLNEIVRSYLELQKQKKVRSRYERSDEYWNYVQSLSSIRGLDSVALDKSQEILLKKELETFVNDKEFYERIGMPYRRGILLYGKPGTGKTSLINAISAQLSRDIYYLNLKNIKDDNELSAAFSDVPENQIIVLEDVDTQSKVLHKRTSNSDSLFIPSVSLLSSDDNKKEDKDKAVKVDKFSDFSLSTFLGCLDGHVLAEGNIIIMTTNHVEHLDPACVRPGRMDVHLNLGYCTHYQINKMYKSVVENPETEFPKDILEKIPEKLLPPCEVMMTMILYRGEVDLIPQKIYELVAKYKNIKSEEEEAEKEEVKNEIKKDEVKDEIKEKEEVKDEIKEKEEVKDEIKEKEEVKDEIKEKEEVKDEIKEKEEVKDEIKEKEEVKDEIKEKEEVKDEINEKEEVKDEIKEKEEVKDEIKEKEEVKDEIKEKEEVKDEINKKEEEVKDENKEEDKKGEGEANINNLNEAEEDSDSNTDVESENDNYKTKYFKTVETETLIITPQVA